MISFIIPTLQEEAVIEKLLKNLKELTLSDSEIIVSDGGSTDKTTVIAKNFADKVVENLSGQRQTIAEGRNAGAAAAVGDYLVFIDADVFIYDINNFFQQALNFFNQQKDLVALCVFLRVFPEQATLADKFFFFLANYQKVLLNNIFHSGSATGEFQMIATRAFKRLGGFNNGLAVSEDDELFGRLAQIGATKIATNLCVYHTGRRAHKIGWFKLLMLWWINLFYIKVFKRSFSKQWEVIR